MRRTKRHEDDLHARIGRERGETLAQDFEEAFLDRELVEKNQVENNPADGQQPVTRAIDRGRAGRLHRHSISHERHHERDREAEQRGVVDAHLEQGDGAEQHDDGDRRDQRGEQDVAERIVVLGPVHDGCGE